MSNEKRFKYDLSHMCFQAGRMGLLMTLSTVPVIAGDRIACNMEGVFRLSPLRRNLTMDAKVDLFYFFVPYRHIYGDTWIDFIKEGVDETQTFPSINFSNTNRSALGGPYTQVRPLWLQAGYNRIWNRYFRHPTADGDIKEDTDQFANNEEAIWGYGCAFLPTIWNTPIEPEVDSADTNVAVTSGEWDLLDFARQQARLTTERRREFYAQRYNDVLARTFGSNVNTDADERPTLLMRNSFWLSGYDVDGTGDASLGTYTGKAATIGRINMPHRFFPEHGTLWCMALVRFPTVHEKENHYLTKIADPSYTQWAGDPDVVANEGPETVNLQDYFNTDGGIYNTDQGIAPYAQWYRTHPNHVHFSLDQANGFAFIDTQLSNKQIARYHTFATYDRTFQTTQFGHWQYYARHSVDANRVIPPVESSIFAGTR